MPLVSGWRNSTFFSYVLKLDWAWWHCSGKNFWAAEHPNFWKTLTVFLMISRISMPSCIHIPVPEIRIPTLFYSDGLSQDTFSVLSSFRWTKILNSLSILHRRFWLRVIFLCLLSSLLGPKSPVLKASASALTSFKSMTRAALFKIPWNSSQARVIASFCKSCPRRKLFSTACILLQRNCLM